MSPTQGMCVDDGVLLAASFHGDDRISAPFRFELDLRSPLADLDGYALQQGDNLWTPLKDRHAVVP